MLNNNAARALARKREREREREGRGTDRQHSSLLGILQSMPSRQEGSDVIIIIRTMIRGSIHSKSRESSRERLVSVCVCVPIV